MQKRTLEIQESHKDTQRALDNCHGRSRKRGTLSERTSPTLSCYGKGTTWNFKKAAKETDCREAKRRSRQVQARRLLLKDLIYVIFSKRQIEPCVLKHDWSLPKEAVNRKFSVNCKHSLQSRGVKTTRSFVAYLLSENTKTIARRQLEVHAPFTFSITL